MTALPPRYSDTVGAIFKAYEDASKAEGPRSHLGASLIGEECERKLWYGFRWAGAEDFEGRMLRLFKRGHLEELRFIEDLRLIGVTVHEVNPETGEQFRVSAIGGHFGGSMDGCAIGVLEAPKTWHVLEFKTHGDKSFKELAAKGVRGAKPQHYVQMQIYMGLTGMTRAYYLAVNKNDDNIYSERIEFCEVTFKANLDKARRVIFASRPPEKISQYPEYWKCKWCTFMPICHQGKAPLENCRTCRHAQPREDGAARWHCTLHDEDLTTDKQLKGCSQWENVLTNTRPATS